MKSAWIRKGYASRLVVFFAGFACDENILASVRLPDSCDILVFFDYRDFNFDADFADLSGYSRIGIVAWSFGVWAADVFRDKFPSACEWIAINGSPYPVDDERGIPVEIFKKTLSDFSESTREKFYRRVCGGVRETADHSKMLCSRSAQELSDELETLSKAFASEKTGLKGRWSRVFASSGDGIFPIKNLRSAFGNSLQIVDGRHLNPPLIERALEMAAGSLDRGVAHSFEKSVSSYNSCAFVQRKISGKLANLLFESLGEKLECSAHSVLEIGCGTGFLTRIVSEKIPKTAWLINDLSAKMCKAALSKCMARCSCLAGDFMEADFSLESFDLVLSSSCFQWIKDKFSLFDKVFKISSKSSVLAFSTFGMDNFREVRDLTGSGLRYDGFSQTRSLLARAGYSVVFASEELIEVEFSSPIEVLRHIRSTGVNGGFAQFWTPGRANKFSREYLERYGKPGGSVLLTYNPHYFICSKAEL